MGSIEHRSANSWRVGVQITDETGARRWIRRTVKLDAALTVNQQRRQAEKALRQLEIDVEAGRARPDTAMTVRGLAELYMRRAGVNFSPVTAANYQHLLDRRILPILGDVPLDKLTSGMLADFIAGIRDAGRFVPRLPDDQLVRPRTPSDRAKLATDPTKPLSARTLVAYYDLIYQMCDKAVKWELMWHNPMSGVDRPRFRQPRANYLDDDQAVALLRALKDVDDMSFRCAVLLALTCGLRLGEVGALTWQDVDWDKCTLDVSKAAKYTAATGNIVGDTKTPSSVRTLTLPAGMMAVLHEAKAEQDDTAAKLGDRWRGVDRIVCAWDGAPLHHDTPSKQFRRFADRHGFPGITFHQLRHTHATLLFASNIDAVAVATRLGHAKADTTLRIYAHALRSRDVASAAAMQTLFTRADAPTEKK